MNHVRDEVDVALPATPTGVRTERLLHGEAQEEQFDVMDVELVRGLPLACTFLEVSVVPEEQNKHCNRSKFPGKAQSGRQSLLERLPA